ncbi:hypothetical protein EST38_g3489 [Candolleomyces aberdarensis]|uniref:Sld7 C-terminal domain-containing protein n=1 Tax=Candolleomyces aberdarensis TaxID=2316362 RepID=A0A4Q2DS52_9AGAR|nr:hypothetical protein EST38_g3489 [Candolleomyces aberdarensis]
MEHTVMCTIGQLPRAVTAACGNTMVYGVHGSPLREANDYYQGVIKLADVYMDGSGSVEMDIHPRAILTRIYFENMFCLKPFPNNGKAVGIRSDIGIKVALGDSDGPETTQIAVYAQVKPSDDLAEGKTPTIQLRVGRLTLRPPQQKLVRLPRPDDPIPRKPPIVFGRGDLKRVASGTLALNGGAKRPKLLGGGNSVSNLGSGVRLAATASSGDVFKVPELPKQAAKQAKEKEKAKEKEDVFGGVSEVGPAQGASAKAKRKTDELDELLELEEDDIDGGALERANKNKIKKATVSHLAQTKDPAKKGMVIDKNHPDFKEFYGAVYRGVCFAVRGRIRLESVDLAIVERLLKLHTKMYLTGLGPPAT